jgi:Septum formation
LVRMPDAAARRVRAFRGSGQPRRDHPNDFPDHSRGHHGACARRVRRGGEGTETTTTAPAVETSAPTQAQETAPAGAEEVDVFDLGVGDCLTDYRATEGIVSVPTVLCSEPHSGEIYAVVPLPEGDGNYPGVEAISAQAEEICIAEFERFVGLSFEESVLEFSFLAPEETEWDTGDREVLCMVHDPAGVTTGTLADANR